MSEHVTETEEEQAAVFEDRDDDRARMRLLEERIEAQGGIEPEVPDIATRGSRGSPETMIAQARKHLGYREKGVNDTIFNRWLGRISGYPEDGYGYPWCHSFESYCLWHSDNASAGPRTAGCESGVNWFKQHGRFSSIPHVGDLVYYGPGGGTHVELVIGISPNALHTIGGNTSGSVDGHAFFNGDGVYEKWVKRTSRIFGFGHPQYGSGAATAGSNGSSTATAGQPITTVRTIRQQQKAVNELGYTPRLDVDGEWGLKTEAGVKWLQRRIGADVDGQWGDQTERKFTAFSD